LRRAFIAARFPSRSSVYLVDFVLLAILRLLNAIFVIIAAI